MRNTFVFLFCLFIFRVLTAQKITLEEATRRALENRQELKSQALEIRIAQNANDKIKAQWRPQLSGTADLRWNTQLQTNVLPVGEFGIPGIPPETTQEIAFGVPFNTSFGVQAEQKIYDGNRKIDRALNEAQVAGAQNQLVQLQIGIRRAVAEAYYAVLYNREKVKLAGQTLSRNQVNLETGQARLKEGTALKNDVDRLALDVSNAQLSLRKARQDLSLSLDHLRYQIRADTGEAIEPAENLATFMASATPDLIASIETRPEIQAEAINLQINDLKQKKELARLRPSVSAYGNYSVLQLSEDFNPFASGTWFPYNYLGVRAETPIFDGKQARLAARDAELRSQQNRLNLEKLKSEFNYELQSARKAFDQAQLELEETGKNVALARQIYETDVFRFQQGVLLQNDLKNSELSLQTAENNYLTAVYNWLVAELGFRKAAGRL